MSLKIDEESKPILPEKWDSMTVTELLDQKTILMDRYYFAAKNGATYVDDLAKGLKRLENIIFERLNS